jgi:AcrR family transcriptional regulator
MTATSRHTADSAQEGGLIWERAPKEKERRERPTREAVVAAAIALADAEGLDAVSIRRVAAALQARPMGLYSFFDRKDELIDLMTDEVLAGAVLHDVPAGWRAGLSALASATRDVCTAHPWLVVAGMRPKLGPNAIRHFEQSLQAVAGLDISPGRKLAILRAVDTYALGYVQVALAQQQAHRREGRSSREWQDSARAYLARLADSGDYPQLAALGTDTLLRDEDDDPAFSTGLTWMLDGIATAIRAPTPATGD